MWDIRPVIFFCSQMSSKTNIVLKPGNVMNGNTKQKLLGYIEKIQRELKGIGINLYNDKTKNEVIAGELASLLNKYNFGLHEGNDVNINTITKFINRIRQQFPIDRPLPLSLTVIG